MMATKFVKGEVVKVNTVIPQGPVEKLRMDEDGVFWYQISWNDINGDNQIRWFREDELVAVD
jgi:uncharacterized protein YodC (DUF2158 family)